jgi:hypothetical protein
MRPLSIISLAHPYFSLSWLGVSFKNSWVLQIDVQWWVSFLDLVNFFSMAYEMNRDEFV